MLNRSNRSNRTSMQGRPMGLFSRFNRGLKKLAYNTADLLRRDDGFYEDERRFSASVLNQRQYYGNNFAPPSSPYSNVKEDRRAYKQYVQENEVYIPADDEVVSDKPVRKGGLSKKLGLKTKNLVKQGAELTVNTTKGVASTVSDVTSVAASEVKKHIHNKTKNTVTSVTFSATSCFSTHKGDR